MVICFTKSLGWNIVVWHENVLGLARNCLDDLAALDSTDNASTQPTAHRSGTPTITKLQRQKLIEMKATTYQLKHG